MFEAAIAFLNAINTLSPLGVIGLLAMIVYMLVKAKAARILDVSKMVQNIGDNHLHELPAMASDLRKIVETLQRMETRMAEDFAHIKATVDRRT